MSLVRALPAMFGFESKKFIVGRVLISPTNLAIGKNLVQRPKMGSLDKEGLIDLNFSDFCYQGVFGICNFVLKNVKILTFHFTSNRNSKNQLKRMFTC